MAVIVLVGSLFLATFGFVAGVENKTETYSAQSATDGITELTVKAELPVRIILLYAITIVHVLIINGSLS